MHYTRELNSFSSFAKISFTDVNWGSTTQAQTYNNALTAVQQLDRVEEHVKNYRPQLLVLTGAPNARSSLVDFAHHITKHQSLFICGHIIEVSSFRFLLARVFFSFMQRVYSNLCTAYFRHPYRTRRAAIWWRIATPGSERTRSRRSTRWWTVRVSKTVLLPSCRPPAWVK